MRLPPTSVLLIIFLAGALKFSSAQGSGNETVNNSDVAFTIKEKNLIPENLAYDNRRNCFYVGSTYQRKVVKQTPDGQLSDFIREGQDGQWMVVGMKVDSFRDVLWFCSSIGDVMKGYQDGDFGKHTGVFKYSLMTGKLIRKYLPEPGSELHFFNDLVLDKNGDVFITDMAGKSIYVIRSTTDQLEVFCKPESFSDPNGICISANAHKLFVATNEGIQAVDLSTKKASLLTHPESIKTNGIDGLYFYRNSLIAVQNEMSRVVRFQLDDTQSTIISSKVIEANYPFFTMNPTTGVIVGNEFYYIANSQFGSFDKEHQIFPMEKLYEVIVLKKMLL